MEGLLCRSEREAVIKATEAVVVADGLRVIWCVKAHQLTFGSRVLKTGGLGCSTTALVDETQILLFLQDLAFEAEMLEQ